MRKVSLAAGYLAAVLLVLGASVALAETVTVSASTVVCLPDWYPDSTWDGSGGIFNVPNDRRDLVYEFDISGVSKAITGATLQVYADSYGPNATAPVDQTTALLSPAGISTLTWNTLSGKTQTSFDSLGYLSMGAGALNTWYDAGSASTSDAAKLEALRTGSGFVTMRLIAGSGTRREWGYAGDTAPRLVLTTSNVPEPTTGLLLASGLLGLVCYAWRKRK